MSALPSPAALAEAIVREARGLGFARVGFTPVESFDRAGAELERWLAAEYHGEMSYLADEPRHDPTRLLANARSLIVVALPWAPGRPPLAPTSLLRGQIARYAQGADYHDVMRDKLRRLAARLPEIAGRAVESRCCVDSAPLLEREAARRAGIGFIAKNTLLLAPGLGTQHVLGEILVDLELGPSAAIEPGCGSCRACLDACPTGAFVAPYVLDARRCISYLTIELKGAIPRELRPSLGTRVFGCDDCQRVCPHNAGADRPSAPELDPYPRLALLDLVALLELSAAGYRRLVKRTALRRANRARLARNAAVALGNLGDRRAAPHLARALLHDPSPLVRAHAAWALGRLGGSRAVLEAAQDDPEPEVRTEIAAALVDEAAQDASGFARA